MRRETPTTALNPFSVGPVPPPLLEKFAELQDKFATWPHARTREEAEQAARATLRTLSERLAGGEPHDLASQLPPELAAYVRYDEEHKSDSFSLEEFFGRVAKKEGVDEPSAVYHSRVVIEILQEALTGGEIDHIRSQLPPKYSPLFEAGSQGEMSA